VHGPVASLAGTLDSTPPVVGVEFLDAATKKVVPAPYGGWPSEIPAKAEYIGAGCGGAHATIYQAFSQDMPFDLAAGLTFTPDVYPAPNAYTVTGGAPPIDPTKLNGAPDSAVDDALVTHALGYTFDYPGGSTTTIKPSTNGFVWLDATMIEPLWQPTRSSMLGVNNDYRARFLAFWADLTADRNTGLDPLAGLHVRTDTSGGPGNAVTWCTWNKMGTFRTPGGPTIHSHAIWTFQCVFFEATGVVQFRYGSMMPFHSTLWSSSQQNACIVGFTRGRIANGPPVVPSLDPQPRDLSHELPWTTSAEGAASNVSLTGVASPIAGSVSQTGRMFGGQTLSWNVANIPAGTVFAALNLDLGASQPGIMPPAGLGITAPGCRISTSLSPVSLGHELWVLPAASVTGIVPLAIPHGWEGAVITAQAIGLDVSGGPWLVPWSSNAIRYVVGLD
jgi:hypothetical protein